jgi:hypothetical protein
MGIELNTFFLYRITTSLNIDRYLLLRIERPRYSNAVQAQEDKAYSIQEQWRQQAFNYYISQYLKASEFLIAYELTAESDELPIGEDLNYDEIIPEINIYTAQTSYGNPWRLFGTASDQTAFWLHASVEHMDEAYKPFPPINSYLVVFIPDNAILADEKRVLLDEFYND